MGTNEAIKWHAPSVIRRKTDGLMTSKIPNINF